MLKKYGWISVQSIDAGNDGFFYERTDGSQIEVCEITDNPNKHNSGWTDMECIGEVTKFIAKISHKKRLY